MTEQDKDSEVQIRIDIILQSIRMYQEFLARPGNPDERSGEIVNKLRREERNLENLKSKYPEYFI